MHSVGLELTKLTYTRLEDNLIRYGGDRILTLYDPVAVAVLTLTRIIKSVVTGHAPVTLEWRNTRGKKTQLNQSCGISELTQFMPRPETSKKC